MSTTAERPRIVGLDKWRREFEKEASKVLRTVVRQDLFDYLKIQLETNTQPDGSPRPSTSPQGKKKPSTIKAYEKKGWDTEHYLVATGESTKLNAKMSDGGLTLTITPERPEILGFHIPESQHRGKIDWMSISDGQAARTVKLLSTELAKRFRK